MLRVHAMYNRSRRVLIFLIACWLVRIVGAVILTLDALESDDALLGEISRFNLVQANNMLAFSTK